MRHTDPKLAFCNDIKPYIFNIMRDDTPISVFISELNPSTENPHFTNGLVI
jgi:hypothetical protein